MAAPAKASENLPVPAGAPDLSRYSGAEKAAIVLMSLGEDAKPLWSLLDEEEIKEVSQAMAGLGMVPSSVVEALVHEFVNRMSGAGSVMGSLDQTQRMLAQILPKEKLDGLMDEIRGPAGRNIWDKLGNVHETVLASYLKNEYPQTVAVVLAKVRPEHAAKVLAELPQDFAAECVMRMLAMEPVQRDILEKVETTLRTEFMSNLARTSKRDSHELMAEIFNNFDRQTESRFMGALEGKSNESADRIKALMFVFEDLGKLDSGGVQTLLRAVDKSDLALGLKGASDTLRNLFFSNMSERGGKLLKDEMASMGPVRLKDVDAAQTRMVATAKELSARGEIVLSDGKSEDELIY
ncbi:flagellar motor switch protein FliG [Terricaulis sp.]|jgi:flagellar motor switch protein FliG|uniref:flagellar motor switch protein FliG n=1 Tax=Terricaulis sp. TaxID=2768686 RepID=UPI003784F41A|nr:flagellar motor switch protein FliG [Hyphomonadaceae bacterium]